MCRAGLRDNAMAGRPSKFSQKVADRFLTAISAGNTRKAACHHAGISEDTLARWLKGEGGRGIEGFKEFPSAVINAESDTEVRNVAIIAKAAQGFDSGYKKKTVKTVLTRRKTTSPDGTVVEEMVPIELVTEETISQREFDWKAGAWWLERRRAADWGSRQKVEVTGADGGPIESKTTYDLDRLDESDLTGLEATLVKALAPVGAGPERAV